MSRGLQPSSGDRVVYCSRVDCAFSGSEVDEELMALMGLAGIRRQMFECEAEVIVMDRRPKFGKTCGRFARRA